MKIEWSDPPPRRGGRNSGKFDEFAQVLRANPGRWAKWPVKYKTAASASSVASSIKYHTHCPKPFLQENWETVVRQGILYIRYLGE